jgi:outer membrane biogenesis lipoprotein LolB
MKKLFVPILAAASAMLLLTGCLNLQVGGGTKSKAQRPTIGQQLIDLQKAKDIGAITEAEYQAQKAKLLESK